MVFSPCGPFVSSSSHSPRVAFSSFRQVMNVSSCDPFMALFSRGLVVNNRLRIDCMSYQSQASPVVNTRAQLFKANDVVS